MKIVTNHCKTLMWGWALLELVKSERYRLVEHQFMLIWYCTQIIVTHLTVFFFFFLTVHFSLLGRQREGHTHRDIFWVYWFAPQMSATARPEPSWSLGDGNSPASPMRIAGTQVLESLSAASIRVTLAGGWIKKQSSQGLLSWQSDRARGCLKPRLNTLYHNTPVPWILLLFFICCCFVTAFSYLGNRLHCEKSFKI